ncbi:MAG: response regulator [Acidobacteriota bacterium]|nr:response regulator [Acidobacteriota bacterium]
MARILLADDDARQLQLRARLLEASGHEVSLAGHASEVIPYLATSEVVIIDLRFPNSQGQPDAAEGLKLIRQIRESGCRAPVIVISGWPEDLSGTPEERMVSRVMQKPVAIESLLGAIAELATGGSAPS